VSARAKRRKGRTRPAKRSDSWLPRWYWPAFALPGVVWMLGLFLLPFYVVVSIAFGTVDPLFRSPLPVFQPWFWTGRYMAEEWDLLTGDFRAVELRTLIYVMVASAICLVIAYTVAYFAARCTSGRLRVAFLVMLAAPLLISYLMRMLAWVELLQPDGYVNRILTSVHLIPRPIHWLSGMSITVVMGLVYGYVPYLTLLFYGFLDRIDRRVLEASRDLGASRVQTFVRVTLPLSKPAILAGIVITSLPMFGDYYTNNLLSGSPRTTMFGNLLDNAMGSTGQGPEAATLVLFLLLVLLVPMIYYMRSSSRLAAG